MLNSKQDIVEYITSKIAIFEDNIEYVAKNSKEPVRSIWIEELEVKVEVLRELLETIGE